ncbi:MAG: hypothetical protein ACRDJC_05700 [Thermomicrobiales bacterium]
MTRLEELERDALVRGIGNGDIAVVDVRWFGDSTIELTYKDAAGRLSNELLYRDDESRYVSHPIRRKADWAAVSVGYDREDLLARFEAPR